MKEELSSIREDCNNLRADLNEMTLLVTQMKENVEKSLSTLSTEVQNTYDYMIAAGKRKFKRIW